MALKYDYKGILEVDDATLSTWNDRISQIEEEAVMTAKHLNPNISDDSLLLQHYAQELVFITLFGDTLSTSLLSFHQDKLQSFEDGIKYGLE